MPHEDLDQHLINICVFKQAVFIKTEVVVNKVSLFLVKGNSKGFDHLEELLFGDKLEVILVKATENLENTPLHKSQVVVLCPLVNPPSHQIIDLEHLFIDLVFCPHFLFHYYLSLKSL